MSVGQGPNLEERQEAPMRRSIVHPHAGKIHYEIRDIVAVAKTIESRWHIPIIWENIGDPVKKGEIVPEWIRSIVAEKTKENCSYAYSETEGIGESREFLAAQANQRRTQDVQGTNGNTLPGAPCSRLKQEDIIFFNGLGDAIGKLYHLLNPVSRILIPSPCYPAHAGAETFHSGKPPITYLLDPLRNWEPDLNQLEQLVEMNPDVVGIVYINPGNPTGTVYAPETLLGIVEIARRHGLFIIADETYLNIHFGPSPTASLAQVIGDVPGIALRSISKEIPWPGARCGWIEVYNKATNREFALYIEGIAAAKRLEVCATSLPQLCIPAIMGNPQYSAHLEKRKAQFAQRAQEAREAFRGKEGLTFIMPEGAFYATVLFDTDFLAEERSKKRPFSIETASLASYIESIIEHATHPSAPDKRFAYWLLASTGICVVPLSGFATEFQGFRFTLLEQDDRKRQAIFATLAERAQRYMEEN